MTSDGYLNLLTIRSSHTLWWWTEWGWEYRSNRRPTFRLPHPPHHWIWLDYDNKKHARGVCHVAVTNSGSHARYLIYQMQVNYSACICFLVNAKRNEFVKLETEQD